MAPTKLRILLLLAAATVLAYANTLSNSFVWDDEVLVCENTAIRNSTYIPAVFTSGLYHHDTASTAYYRPLQPVSFMVDYYIWGLNPLGYHLTNLLWHLLCVILVWLLLDRLGQDRLLALLPALVFAVHPVNTNAVTYIAGRADSMALAGMLGCLLLYIRYQDKREAPLAVRVLLYAASVTCFVAALFSRESAMVLPALILLYSLTLGATARRPLRNGLAATLPFVIILLAFFLWRANVLALNSQTLFVSWALPGWVRAQAVFRALATYCGLLGWPAHLQMERQVVAGGALLHFLTGVGVSLAIGLVAALWWTRRASPLAFFALGWFLITILPLLGIFNLAATVAEHWLYVPSIGIYLAVSALGFQKLASPIRQRPAWAPQLATGLCAIVLLALAARTIRRNQDWADARTFFAVTEKASAYTFGARVNLGRELLGRGEWDKAAHELAEAEHLNPGDSFAKANLTSLYLSRGEIDKALAKNEECLGLNPRDLGARLRLAQIYDQRHDFVRARWQYTYATTISETVGPRILLAKFFLRNRRFREALDVVHEAQYLEPGNAEVLALTGAILAEAGQPALAEAAFQKARLLDRHSPNADVNLGRLAAQRGDWAAAALSYRRALRIQPHEVRALYQLGLIHWRNGNTVVAELELRQALAIAPASSRIGDALRRLNAGATFAQASAELLQPM